MPQMHPVYWFMVMLGVWGLMIIISASSWSSFMLDSEKGIKGHEICDSAEFWVLFSTM